MKNCTHYLLLFSLLLLVIPAQAQQWANTYEIDSTVILYPEFLQSGQESFFAGYEEKDSSIHLAKVDASGNYTFLGTAADGGQIKGIAFDADSMIYILHDRHTKSPGHTAKYNLVFGLTKMNRSGQLIWTKFFGDPNSFPAPVATAIAWGKGGMHMAFHVDSSTVALQQIVTVDTGGVVQSRRRLSGSTNVNAIEVTPSGSYILSRGSLIEQFTSVSTYQSTTVSGFISKGVVSTHTNGRVYWYGQRASDGLLVELDTMLGIRDTTKFDGPTFSGFDGDEIFGANKAPNGTSHLVMRLDSQLSLYHFNTIGTDGYHRTYSLPWTNWTGSPVLYSGKSVLFAAFNYSEMALFRQPITAPVNLGNDTTICAGNCAVLEAHTMGGSRIWSNGDTAYSTLYCTLDTNSAPFTMEASIIAYFFRDTLYDTVQITVSPIKQMRLIQNDTTLCYGTDFIMTATGGGASGYTWRDGGTVITSFTGKPTVSIRPGSSVKIYVDIDNGLCKVTDSITITVFREGAASARNLFIKTNSPYQTKLFPDTIQSHWLDTFGVSDSALANPVLFYPNGTRDTIVTYIVRRDEQPCYQFDSVRVFVKSSTPKLIQASYCDSGLYIAVNTFDLPGFDHEWNTGSGWFAAGDTISFIPKGTEVVLRHFHTSLSVDTLYDTISYTFTSSTPKLRSTDTLICLSDTATFIVTGADSVLWVNSVGQVISTDSIARITASTSMSFYGTFFKGSCTKSDSIFLTIDTTCVWPGDVNGDKVVNNFDVLWLGLSYNDSGASRNDKSLASWRPQWVADWTMNIDSLGRNAKHADADGNGLVDTLDVLPIVLNYSNTHFKNGPEETPAGNGAPLFLYIPDDTVSGGQKFTVDIHLGTAQDQADSIYGVAFTLEYDSRYIDSTTNFDLTGSWLGKPENLIALYQDFPADSRADIAISRKNKLDTFGYGRIARLDIVVKDDIAGGIKPWDYVKLKVWKDKALSSTAKEVPLLSRADSVIVLLKGSGLEKEEKNLQQILVYPNPSDGRFMLDLGEIQATCISICDLQGRCQTLASGKLQGQVPLDTPAVKGLYLLRIQTSQHLYYSQIQIR